jgi:hypothetical protein
MLNRFQLFPYPPLGERARVKGKAISFLLQVIHGSIVLFIVIKVWISIAFMTKCRVMLSLMIGPQEASLAEPLIADTGARLRLAVGWCG